MPDRAWLGVDVGTASTKGVLVDDTGRVLAAGVRPHRVSRPRPGHVELDPAIWWQEFRELAHELTSGAETPVVGVGVSGMGPAVLPLDADGEALRPAILYGVDTRAEREIAEQTRRFGRDAVVERCGMDITTQAVGPKLAWLRRHEPEIASETRRFTMVHSELVRRLTGEYVLDHHAASQSVPLYDAARESWIPEWAREILPDLELPRLAWSDEVVGTVSDHGSAESGLRAGIPVVAGSIDAWTEAESVGALGIGDLLLMYGSTMFLIATTGGLRRAPGLWSTQGLRLGERSVAGGMATSGSITDWVRRVTGEADFAALSSAAAAAGPGARGLLMLPYFAGERTPIADPRARGAIIGLTLETSAGDLYRAALEATAFGVRHNLEALEAHGIETTRIVAAGGGVTGGVWTQVVSDVVGRAQIVPTITIGASYGAAKLAARGAGGVDVSGWNARTSVIEPDPGPSQVYDERYADYRRLYEATADIMHRLAQ